MISVQGGDSCGRSGRRETPQTRMRRGVGFFTTVKITFLFPARGKRSLARKSTAVLEIVY
nr:hypothetical protein [Bacillus sp. FJAT-45066]